MRFLGSVGVAIVLAFCVFFVLMHNVLCIPGFSILLVAPGYTLRFLGSVGVAIILVFCVFFVLMSNANKRFRKSKEKYNRVKPGIQRTS
jgi:hypothetical protein